jgi:hypothetical protein
MDNNADFDYTRWLNEWASIRRLHPLYHYAGPWDAPIVVVGQRKEGPLPFREKYATQFAWDGLNYMALVLGWTYAQEIPPQHLRTKNGIISCGDKASQWVKFHVSGEAEVLQLPAPKYLLTRQTPAEVSTVYGRVRAFVENHIKDEDNG